MDRNETLKNNITHAGGLRTYIRLTSQEEEHVTRILERFPVTITKYHLSLIDWDNPEQDPVFRMFIPSVRETGPLGGFDTGGKADNTVLPGLQHKYAQTVPILSTHRCAMYRRYYFRKRLVGIPGDETAGNMDEMAAYIGSHPEITSIFISGGDSLLNSNQTIRRHLEAFSSISHLDLIRFSTHTPMVPPVQIYDDPELLNISAPYTKIKQIYVVTQFSHSKELAPEAVRVIQCLIDAGVIVKNQIVLLKGINGDTPVSGALLRSLTRYGVIPYYIFQCRPASGIKGQFQIPLTGGCRIVEGARNMQNDQGKYICYAMSHVTDKIEILGPASGGKMLLKYHQAKCGRDLGRIFSKVLVPGQARLQNGVDHALNKFQAAGYSPGKGISCGFSFTMDSCLRSYISDRYRFLISSRDGSLELPGR